MHLSTTDRAPLSTDRLLRSELFCGYDQAFRRLTQLPLAIAPAGTEEHALAGDGLENPFCAAMRLRSDTGRGLLLDMQRELHAGSEVRPHSISGFGGLIESAVPLRNGGELIGWLRTGQVFVGNGRPLGRSEIKQMLVQQGIGDEIAGDLGELWGATRLVDRSGYEAAVDLLAAFGSLLGDAIGRLAVDPAAGDNGQIARAKKFIKAKSDEPLRLGDVAKVAGMSANYFSSEFRKAVGMTFTEFLATTRVEAAKRRLVDPRERVCETAFDVGFRSLSQFNRTFRKISGESPSEFRNRSKDMASEEWVVSSRVG